MVQRQIVLVVNYEVSPSQVHGGYGSVHQNNNNKTAHYDDAPEQSLSFFSFLRCFSSAFDNRHCVVAIDSPNVCVGNYKGKPL